MRLRDSAELPIWCPVLARAKVCERKKPNHSRSAAQSVIPPLRICFFDGANRRKVGIRTQGELNPTLDFESSVQFIKISPSRPNVTFPIPAVEPPAQGGHLSRDRARLCRMLRGKVQGCVIQFGFERSNVLLELPENWLLGGGSVT